MTDILEVLKLCRAEIAALSSVCGEGVLTSHALSAADAAIAEIERGQRELGEKIAREMCAIRGHDPDELVPETGYSDAKLIPRWHKQYEWALRAIAAHKVLGSAGAAS